VVGAVERQLRAAEAVQDRDRQQRRHGDEREQSRAVAKHPGQHRPKRPTD
jgi:hypothetical protein